MMDGEEYQAGQFAFSLRTRLFRYHAHYIREIKREPFALNAMLNLSIR